MTTSNQPSHLVYHVKDIEGSKADSLWTQVGAMWPHKNGEGWNMQLDLLPVSSGKLIIRVNKPKDASKAA